PQPSRLRGGKQLPGRALAFAYREQLALWRFGHPANVLCWPWWPVLSHGARREKRAPAACPSSPWPDSVAATGAPVRRRGMDIRDGFVGSVGNTPLIKLRRASE